MTSADDLAPIIASAARDDSDIGFRQGVVEAWDEFTGTNAVNVNGTRLTNLPCLNLGEFVLLQPGDVVGLLRVKNSYFILGRIILPAGPDNNRASIGSASSGASAVGFSVPGAGGLVQQQIMNIPDWADMITIHLTVDASVRNTTANADIVYLAGYIDGAAGGEMYELVDPSRYVAMSASAIRTIANPGTQITIGARMRTESGASWSSSAGNIVNVNASATYWRVD